jgi:glyoxylase-like metal-dependent hydrolase (beta-lactamase superfamily II)
MNLIYQPMGAYQTNCYIVSDSSGEIIIDPGMGATEWVLENVKNPLAILNTHGHFDHVWSNKELKERLNIPIYCPKDDAFMLENDPFGQGTPSSKADVLVEGDKSFKIGDIEVKYLHFPGHTPGCSAIEIGENFFSGDFIFAGSIGRVDFPYSSPEDMKKSIKKFLEIKYDKKVYTGHGNPTTIKQEQKTLPAWLEYI